MKGHTRRHRSPVQIGAASNKQLWDSRPARHSAEHSLEFLPMATDHFVGACVNMLAFGHGLAGSSFGAMSSTAQLEAEARAGVA